MTMTTRWMMISVLYWMISIGNEVVYPNSRWGRIEWWYQENKPLYRQSFCMNKKKQYPKRKKFTIFCLLFSWYQNQIKYLQEFLVQFREKKLLRSRYSTHSPICCPIRLTCTVLSYRRGVHYRLCDFFCC